MPKISPLLKYCSAPSVVVVLYAMDINAEYRSPGAMHLGVDGEGVKKKLCPGAIPVVLAYGGDTTKSAGPAPELSGIVVMFAPLTTCA